MNHAKLDVQNDIESNGERQIQKTVLRNHASREPAVVLDVGAHHGEWSSALLQEAQKLGTIVRVHAFEPTEYSFAKLEMRLRDSPEAAVTANRLALSSAPGEATIYKPHEGAGSSSMHGSYSPDTALSETVACSTVDAYCEHEGLAEVALLKIDAEGHDLEVLRGAAATLGQQAVTVAQFEYNAMWIDSHTFLRDAFEFLHGYGYRLGKVTPCGIELYRAWHRELETFTEANFVAVVPSAVGWFQTIRWWNDA